jgi:hypothetical protein
MSDEVNRVNSDNIASNYSVNNSQMHSLNQGTQFKKNKKNTLENKNKNKNKNKIGKEGFDTTDPNSASSMTASTDQVISTNSVSQSEEAQLQQLQEQYDATLVQYNDLMTAINGVSDAYLSRVNNNPYLGKIVGFTTGHICYVTMQGVVKYIGNMEIWANATNGNYSYIPLSVPWLDSYWTYGTPIANLNLISGSNLGMQSIGNEGSNVFVNTLINNPSASYEGCYADNLNSPLVSFIGGSPPPPSAIVNGNFDQPQIANNSYQYLQPNSNVVPGWTFNAVLAHMSGAWGYPTYPNGNQVASIQMNQNFSQMIYLQAGATYTLTFSACGRNCCDGSGQSNPVDISIQASNITTIPIYTCQPPMQWTNYGNLNFTVPNSQNYSLVFQGTWTAGDRSTAFQNIQLNTSSGASGSYTYSECETAAINNGYQYFALQDVNTSTSKGYCALSNSEPTVTKLGNAMVESSRTPLWASNTYGQPGNTAMLNNQGSLLVINSSGGSVWNSPAQNVTDYIGSYGDSWYRAMPLLSNGAQIYNYASCQQAAQQGGYQYFGLQNSSSGQNAQCAVSNDPSSVKRYGARSSYTNINDGTKSGGGWTNSVYNTQSNISSFLILQDDGKTTDEHILSISNAKLQLGSAFLTSMKEAAVDCTLNLTENEAIGCFTYDGPSDKFMYDPRIKEDLTNTNRELRLNPAAAAKPSLTAMAAVPKEEEYKVIQYKKVQYTVVPKEGRDALFLVTDRLLEKEVGKLYTTDAGKLKVELY